MYNITMILAMDKNKLVGSKKGKYGLAWHYPEDLKFYKTNTINKINVMGRTTFEHIGMALPNRTTYVLTRNKQAHFNGAMVINDVEQVLELSKTGEVMICGGVSVYQTFNQYASKIILTKIDADHDGDVYFKNLDLNSFKLKSSEKGEDSRLKFEVWEKNEN